MSSSPIRLGPFTIEHPFILAPMAGITNSPYRRLIKRAGASVVISELVSANGIEHASHRTMDLLRFDEEERVVGLQIFGEDEANLVKGAQVVERLGADFVDLNLGCPVPKIVKKGAGAALCRDPRALGQILGAMVRAVKIPVTIKIRTGWDESSRNAIDVVRAAADAGVTWVAIHGRTRAQGYAGLADWDLIAEVKAKSPIPIIGNGDLSTPELAVERFRASGVDAVLIGRGALRNPFIFAQARALWRGESYARPTTAQYVELLHAQRALLEASFEGRNSMLHARKFLAWYSAGYPGSHEFRRRVFAIAEAPELWSEAIAFFERSTAQTHRDGSYLAEPFLMGGHG